MLCKNAEKYLHLLLCSHFVMLLQTANNIRACIINVCYHQKRIVVGYVDMNV